MKALLLAMLAAAASTAEVARRDVQFAIDSGDGGFDYTLDTDLGSFAGTDAFDRLSTVRLGGRWSLSRPGSSLGLLVGGDLTRCDAPMPTGGMDGWGADLSAGGTWAFAESWALDAEAFAGWQRVSLDVTTGTTSLAGDGDLLRSGARLRVLYTPWTHWSLGVEGGWTSWQTSISSADGRQLDLDGGGLGAGLVLAWRPSARPAGIE
jgi:hypothetical protein